MSRGTTRRGTAARASSGTAVQHRRTRPPARTSPPPATHLRRRLPLASPSGRSRCPSPRPPVASARRPRRKEIRPSRVYANINSQAALTALCITRQGHRLSRRRALRTRAARRTCRQSPRRRASRRRRLRTPSRLLITQCSLWSASGDSALVGSSSRRTSNSLAIGGANRTSRTARAARFCSCVTAFSEASSCITLHVDG